MLLLALAALAPAQDTYAQEAATGTIEIAPIDVWWSHLKLDRKVVDGHRLPPDADRTALAVTNDAFDAYTRCLRLGDLEAAMERFVALDAALEGKRIGLGRRLAVDVRTVDGWRLNAEVWPKGADAPGAGRVEFRIRGLTRIESAAGSELEVDLMHLPFPFAGKFLPNGSCTIEVDALGRVVPTTFELAVVEGDDASLVAMGPSGRGWEFRSQARGVSYSIRSNDRGSALRAALEARADRLEPSTALDVFRARLALRWESVRGDRPAEFTLDRWRHPEKLVREIEALERGDDPYLRLAGDHWRTVPHAGGAFGARVFRPEDAPDGPIPLVIALGDEGADESFFLRFAGRGHVRGLAKDAGCLVVAPDWRGVDRPLDAFDSLLAAIDDDHEIDPDRVHVLGHGRGATTAAALALARADRIAGACCVAGDVVVHRDTAPVLVVMGERDRLVPVSTVRARVAELGSDHVTYVELEDQGHTLLLPDALDLAFERWFDGSK